MAVNKKNIRDKRLHVDKRSFISWDQFTIDYISIQIATVLLKCYTKTCKSIHLAYMVDYTWFNIAINVTVY